MLLSITKCTLRGARFLDEPKSAPKCTRSQGGACPNRHAPKAWHTPEELCTPEAHCAHLVPTCTPRIQRALRAPMNALHVPAGGTLCSPTRGMRFPTRGMCAPVKGMCALQRCCECLQGTIAPEALCVLTGASGCTLEKGMDAPAGGVAHECAPARGVVHHARSPDRSASRVLCYARALHFASYCTLLEQLCSQSL